MKVEQGQAQIQSNSQQMFQAIQKAQQVNQEMGKKMIRLSLEQQVTARKEMLTNHLVDLLI